MAKKTDLKLEVEYVDIEKLIPDANNAKLHPPEQIDQIAASIRAFGMADPIGVDKDYTIIEGHGRHIACRKLKIKKVPIIMLGHLSETEKKAYIIAHNKLTMNSGFDMELLANEIHFLNDLDYDLELTGFSSDELEDFFLNADEIEMPELRDGDREPFQQVTFTVHDDQKETIDAALKKAKELGGGFDASPNENSNGNALAFICEEFLK